jgi:hypothetical protein
LPFLPLYGGSSKDQRLKPRLGACRREGAPNGGTPPLARTRSRIADFVAILAGFRARNRYSVALLAAFCDFDFIPICRSCCRSCRFCRFSRRPLPFLPRFRFAHASPVCGARSGGRCDNLSHPYEMRGRGRQHPCHSCRFPRFVSRGDVADSAGMVVFDSAGVADSAAFRAFGDARCCRSCRFCRDEHVRHAEVCADPAAIRVCATFIGCR